MTGALLAALAGILCLQLVVARRLPAEGRVLVWLQTCFWAVAFVARPLYMWVAKPINPNPIADVRLAATDYTQVTQILRIVLTGQVCFLLVLLVSASLSRGHRAEPLNAIAVYASSRAARSALFVLFALGWAGRLAHLVGQASISSALSPPCFFPQQSDSRAPF